MDGMCAFATFDLSGIGCINQSQKLIYKEAWENYNRIQSYNSNVSTLRSQGDLTGQYYMYISYKERESFRQGQFLHTQVYPNSNWSSVQEN